MIEAKRAERAEREEVEVPRPADTELPSNAVVENCSKCGTLLDVSNCFPLTETICPGCGDIIKVLREFHRFVLLSTLGQGGAGTVFRAFDETLERDVALKLLRNEHTKDPEFVKGLEREAMITASINHPHVVKVFSAGMKNGYYYLAMEIVGGGSLSQRLKRPWREAERETLTIGIQVAEALKAAFERGLLHRDVKPGNILFVDPDTVKVADFGLAQPFGELNDDAEGIWGTPEYIAPEKVLGRGEDLRSDIYSLGCTLYHCLAGGPPLDTAIVMRSISTDQPHAAPDIQKTVPWVSGATAFVIKRCLEVKPEDRYQTYDELIEHLQYARDHAGEPKENRSIAASNSKDAGPNRRSWLLFGAIGAFGALLAIAAAAGGYIAVNNKRPVREMPRETVVSKPVKSSPPEPTATPEPSTAPLIAGSLMGTFAPVIDFSHNLTALGTDDWAHWNSRYIHKAFGGRQISDLTNIRGGVRGVWHSTTHTISWTDGEPVTSNSGDHDYIWCKGAENAGWSFTVPADLTPRTLSVLYGGADGASVSISAHLSDSSAQDSSSTERLTHVALNLATFNYKAASANQTLTITLLKLHDAGDPSVDLHAAWLTH